MWGLLAGLLLLASEIILWTHPTGRTALDWLALLVGYLALASLVLSMARQYRVRTLFGLLALAGLAGLLNSLLLNPQTALAGVPRTWATRALGAYTLVNLGVLVLALALLARRWRWVWLAAGLVGLLWGIWVRWLAAFTDIVPAAVPLATLLMAGGGALLLCLLLWWQGGWLDRLWRWRWPLIVVGLGLNLIRNLAHIDLISLLVLVSLAIYCWLLLWFQQTPASASSFPLNAPPLSPLPVLLACGLFVGAGAVGYLLPFTENSSPMALLVGLFAAFGLVWLPTVSLVLGIRSFRRLGRQRRL
jgi:hypothetical protein